MNGDGVVVDGSVYYGCVTSDEDVHGRVVAVAVRDHVGDVLVREVEAA